MHLFLVFYGEWEYYLLYSPRKLMNHAASSTQLTVGKQGGAFNFWLVTSQLFLPWFPDGQHSKWQILSTQLIQLEQ